MLTDVLYHETVDTIVLFNANPGISRHNEVSSSKNFVATPPYQMTVPEMFNLAVEPSCLALRFINLQRLRQYHGRDGVVGGEREICYQKQPKEVKEVC
jgi:hypothetical protein